MGEWFGVLSGGVYLPVELYEIARGAAWPAVTVFSINLGVVLYLLWIVLRSGTDGGEES